MKNHAFRKLGRTSSHRGLMLRNLVSSLLEHERIVTTLPKAKEAAREAEKIITMGKKGTSQARIHARDYLFTHDKTLPKLAEYATRYATRPGGYTRIHLFGNRQGDHAPKAILELVDNPHDLRLEMTARAIGRETFARASKLGEEEVRHGKQFELPDLETDKRFNKITRRNIAKVTRFGGEESRARLAQIAQEHIERLNAIRAVEGPYREDTDKARSWKDNAPRGRALTKPHLGCKPLAGQEGEEPAASTSSFRRSSVIRIGRGIFAKRLGWRTAPQSVSRPRARPLSEA